MRNQFQILGNSSWRTGMYLVIFAIVLFVFPEILSWFIASIAMLAGVSILINQFQRRNRRRKRKNTVEYVYYEEVEF